MRHIEITMDDGTNRTSTPSDLSYGVTDLLDTYLQADADPNDHYERWDMLTILAGVIIGRAVAEGLLQGNDARLEHISFQWTNE